MRRYALPTATAIAVAAALGLGSTSAKADLVIDYSLDGGATFTNLLSTTSGGTNSSGASVTLGSFSINTVSDTSNSPGTSSLAKLLSSTLDITNTSGSTQSIIFAFSDTGFTAPTTPPDVIMDSHIGGSVVGTNAANLASFTSCIGTGNTNLDTCAGVLASLVAGPGTPNITTGSFSDDKFQTITSLASPYSINQILDLTLGAGGEINFSDNTTLTPTPTPEPASLLLLGSGLLGLGLFGRRRRRGASA